MTFEENDCIYNIDFRDARTVDIVEETVEKEVEVEPTSWASVVVVVCSYTKEIINFGLHPL